MTARLDLLAHGASLATPAARFPDDEALEASAIVTLEGLGGRLRSYGRVLAAPARAARETAAALGLGADVETALRDCDYGRWRGLALSDVATREPDGFRAWLGDPEAAPHGGESLAALILRVGRWLAEALARDGATLAVTHASVVRAAIASALGAGSPAFWRIDVAPLAVARLSGRDGRWNLVALEALGSATVIRLLAALLTALTMFAASPGEAHRIAATGGPPPDGIAIPSLTHGQMAVIADNLSSIRRLARDRIGDDMATWRLEDYLNLQSFACLWGLVPGSITDESSPFNECAHAYLAAARALLLQLRATPGVDHNAVEALIGKIESEMLANGASLTLCRFSDEPFNTNEVVFPRWSEAPTHPPTVAFAAVLLAAIAGSAWSAWPRRSVSREPQGADA